MMPDKQIYEYSIIRVMPNVMRGEFLNVGVIVFSKPLRYLDMSYHLSEKRFSLFVQDLDVNQVLDHLKAWKQICKGDPDGSGIKSLEIHERFRYLIAPKSTILQCAPVHPGRTNDPEKELKRLFEKYVLT